MKFQPDNLFPNEVWVPITDAMVPNCKPYYLISNYGRVFNHETGRYLHASDASNHLSTHIRVTGEDGKSYDTTPTIHRMMMLAFNPIEGAENLEVDHIDNCSYNNILENLQWITREENIRKSLDNKYDRRYKTMAEEGKNKNSVGDIRYVCKLLQETDLSYPEIAKLTNVNKYIIANIKQHRSYNNISKDYTWPHREERGEI